MSDLTRRQAALARAVLSSATDYAIITTGLDGRVTSWNPGSERLLGWSAAEMIGQTANCLFTPEDCAAGYLGRVPERRLLPSDPRWHHRGAQSEALPLLAADFVRL